MREDCGPAIVLVFANGRREAALVHPHDGGEAYMVPFLKKGIQYAKTHYDSGDIVEVLQSEVETRKIEDNMVMDVAKTEEVRHVYYLSYRWDSDFGKKVYHLNAMHVKRPGVAGIRELPFYQCDIPSESAIIV